MVAEGCKGVWLWHYGSHVWGKDRPALEGVRQIGLDPGDETSRLLWDETSRTGVELRTVGDAMQQRLSLGLPPISASPLVDLRIDMEEPAWFQTTHVLEVTDQGINEVDFSRTAGTVSVKIDKLANARLMVLTRKTAMAERLVLAQQRIRRSARH